MTRAEDEKAADDGGGGTDVAHGDSGTGRDGGGTGGESGGAAADAPPGRRWRRGGGPRRPWWRELPVLIGIALLLAFGIKTFGVQPFSIPSGSMENTLREDDRVLVDKFTPWFGWTPRRGEVVVFRDPGGWLPKEPAEADGALMHGVRTALGFVGLTAPPDERNLIKRVMAVAGDTVTCERGRPLRVNGAALDEPYLHPGATPCDDAPVGTVTVPAGQLWVMGDHRDDSRDSRAHAHQPGGGFVPVENVVGRAFAVAWPVSRWAPLPIPDTFTGPDSPRG
ncbi:signal peptidase I [Streptomyces sp. DH12]|uniref:signal peptidase I n=1 Tax=Streptomyces sp. DH12 TaxID=2857010 RepID=UPI001E42E2F5|nr:signal peptidase I [Streptomyces sp. DH12]